MKIKDTISDILAYKLQYIQTEKKKYANINVISFRIKENFDIFGFELNSEEMKKINGLGKHY